MSTAPQFVSQNQFAQLLSCSKAHVSNLKAAGRLVFNDQGKVDVAASKKRIAATAGAPERAEAGGQPPGYSDAREQGERIKTQLLAIELAERQGKLLPVDDVRTVAVTAITALRTALESLPDQLAPRLAAISSETEVRALLASEIEAVLGELSHKLGEMAVGVGR